MNHLSVLRLLARPILALSAELLVREELVGVLVIGVHIIFRERHEQKDMRLTNDEPNIGCMNPELAPLAHSLMRRHVYSRRKPT
jgi:hypothetical protein